MTREQISTFHTGDGFYELRFSEAEMSDAFNGGFLDAIDRVLEIIDVSERLSKQIPQKHGEEEALSRGITVTCGYIRRGVLALKGDYAK